MHHERRGHSLEKVLQALPDISFVIAASGQYLEVLGGCHDELYRDAHLLVGRHLNEVLPARLAVRFSAVIDETLESRCVQSLEYTLSRGEVRVPGSNPPGSEHPPQWFEARVLPFLDYGTDEPAVLWLAFNITERKRQEEELRRLAATDPLTGLSNRRRAIAQLERLYQRALNSARPLSLVLLDVDHFKRINDGYGHAAGDHILQWVANQLECATRPGDLLARLGGDEFLVALPDTGIGEAAAISSRLLDEAHSRPPAPQGQPIAVSLSAGAATLEPHDPDISALMQRADTALYRAKGDGRGCYRHQGCVHRLDVGAAR